MDDPQKLSPPESGSLALPDRFGFLFFQDRAPEVLDSEAPLGNRRADEAFRWISIRRDSAGAAEELEKLDLDPLVLEALVDEETRPRFTPFGDGAVIILRGVNLHPGAEPEDMISIRLWIEKERIVSVWLRPLAAVGDVKRMLRQGYTPPTPGALVARLALRLIDRAEPVIGNLSDTIDQLEEEALSSEEPPDSTALSRIRRTAIKLRRYLFPQRDALTTLEIEEMTWIGAEDRIGLGEAVNRLTRLCEELDAIRERAAVAIDEIRSRQADAMNHRMLTLSVIAAIFMPATLVSGLLGMNVGGIPLSESPLGFVFVAGGLILLAGTTYIVLRLRRLL